MPEKIKPNDLVPLNYDYLQDRYRQRAKELASKSQGLERLAYRVFGYQLLGSIAFALDPWAEFAFPRVKSSPVNRTRVIPGIARSTRSIKSHSYARIDHYAYYPTSSHTFSESTSDSVTVRAAQSQIDGFIKDTSKRTRGVDTPVGEFEMFVPKISSSSFVYTFQPTHTTSLLTGVSFENNIQELTTLRDGPAFRVYTADVKADSIAANTRAKAAISKNALGMVSKCLPSSRRFNLFYQLAELKDTPQLIRQVLSNARIWAEVYTNLGPRNFSELIRGRTVPKDFLPYLRTVATKFGFHLEVDVTIANFYLAFKFGWESLISSVNSITSKPAILAKQTNRLILRNGTATNFRTSFKWVESGSSPVNFEFDTYGTENAVVGLNKGYRNCQLRCVVNATFNFPAIDVPTFRSLYFRKLGLDVTPLDLINLVPWTWLIDWFVGFSSYLQMMEALWTDDSLINYGFITYVEKTHATLSVALTRSYTTGDWVDGSWINQTSSKMSLNPTAVYESKYQLRLALSSVAGIVTPTSLGLSDFQKSILSALYAKFSGSSRKT